MKNYPIGNKTRKKAAETEAGQLALAMHELLYCGMTNHEKYVVSNRLYTGAAVPDHCREGSYVITEKLLREVRDFLEFQSFRQVIP